MPDPSPSDYRYSEQVGHLLRRAYQRHSAIFQQAVPDSHLTTAQFVLLCAVRDGGSCDVARIVQAIALDEPTVRGIVERLKWRGLLAVDHPPGDARQMTIALTDAGATLLAQTVPFAREISQRTLAPLDADEQRTLLALLRRISGIDDAAAG